MSDGKNLPTYGTMTEEEHIARAMLMGMRYHPGNGDPFYYSMDASGSLDVVSMLDANTLEPLIAREDYMVQSDRAFLATKHAVFTELQARRKQP